MSLSLFLSESTLKEINHEYSLEGLNVETEVPALSIPYVKSRFTVKDLDARKD